MKKIIKEIFFNNIGLTCNFAEALTIEHNLRHYRADYYHYPVKVKTVDVIARSETTKQSPGFGRFEIAASAFGLLAMTTPQISLDSVLPQSGARRFLASCGFFLLRNSQDKDKNYI